MVNANQGDTVLKVDKTSYRLTAYIEVALNRTGLVAVC